MLNKTILTVLAALVLGVPISIASAGYVDAVKALGPLDYWRLGEQAGNALNEGSGATEGVYGSSVNRADAGPRPTDTIGGSQLLGFGSDNTGAGLPGDGTATNSGLNMGVYAPVTGGGARTILAWIKPTATGFGSIVTYGKNSKGQNHLIWKRDGEIMWSAYHSTGQATTDTVPINEWTFFATTLPNNALGSETVVYFNGQPAASTSMGDWTVNTVVEWDFEIGQWAGYDADFIGVIDEVAAFDYELTGQQIAGLFDAATVPEPSTFVMAALGLLGLAFVAWRKRRSR